jgi:L-threonylcarbamoyladenylate synthase
LPAARTLLPDAATLRLAGELLRTGELVAFPTETVYGLGADASDPAAVARIFAAKGRPVDNPLIVHLADAGELSRVAATITPLARSLAAAYWPGPLTLVLDARPEVPRVTTGGLDTVAVRVPGHPVATAVLGAAGIPVAAPSANRSGRPSPTTAAHVAADLGADVALIVDGGACPIGVESTVVDARGSRPVVLREGSVTREDLGLPPDGAVGGDVAASPGTRYRHYAPACAVVVASSGDVARHLEELVARSAGRVGVLATAATAAAAPSGVVEVATFRDAVDLARTLYDGLRTAEDAGVDVLVVEAVAEAGVGRAVMDRLRRAAASTPIPPDSAGATL